MAQRVATLDELRGRTVEGLLNEVAQSEESLTVVLEEGAAVMITPENSLKRFTDFEKRNSEEGNSPVLTLEELKRLRFSPQEKTERVTRSLAALDQAEGIRLTPSEWRFIAEDPDVEDQY